MFTEGNSHLSTHQAGLQVPFQAGDQGAFTFDRHLLRLDGAQKSTAKALVQNNGKLAEIMGFPWLIIVNNGF